MIGEGEENKNGGGRRKVVIKRKRKREEIWFVEDVRLMFFFVVCDDFGMVHIQFQSAFPLKFSQLPTFRTHEAMWGCLPFLYIYI